MNIDDLKIGELKQLSGLLNNNLDKNTGLNYHVGKKVIIRTYSAGVWFGKLIEKCGDEVILKDARRMYRWWCKRSISLSGVAKYGIIEEKSKICPSVDHEWLQAIEILELSNEAIDSLENAEDAEAE